MKKGAKIGIIIGLSVIVLGVIAYRFMPSYSVKDAHTQGMKAMRSAMRRRSSSGNAQANNDVSYYIRGTDHESDMNVGAYADIPDSVGGTNPLKDGMDAMRDSFDSVGDDALARMNTQVQISENRDWRNMIQECKANPEKAQKEFLHQNYTFCGVISQTGMLVGLPYVMFEENGMKAYLFFDSSYAKEIENMDLHAVMRKTITGVCEEITPDTVKLYWCNFGY